MRCGNPSDGPSVSANRAFDSDLIYKKLQNSFSINLLLSRVIIGLKQTLLRLPVASVIPDENVAVSPQEEIKPISV